MHSFKHTINLNFIVSLNIIRDIIDLYQVTSFGPPLSKCCITFSTARSRFALGARTKWRGVGIFTRKPRRVWTYTTGIGALIRLPFESSTNIRRIGREPRPASRQSVFSREMFIYARARLGYFCRARVYRRCRRADGNKMATSESISNTCARTHRHARAYV